ncbi:hypothetical protein [Dickeya fangzhongdai]|uniref:hypothetical protein n=1 Tax=Dickeya fangzhongdai TaxID=1778540 RepID=UPI0006765AE0|nr:hypothetical protein [Dickeya fangzhongdai]
MVNLPGIEAKLKIILAEFVCYLLISFVLMSAFVLLLFRRLQYLSTFRSMSRWRDLGSALSHSPEKYWHSSALFKNRCTSSGKWPVFANVTCHGNRQKIMTMLDVLLVIFFITIVCYG